MQVYIDIENLLKEKISAKIKFVNIVRCKEHSLIIIARTKFLESI